MTRNVDLQPGLHIQCPNCKGVMDRIELPDFCIDQCPFCGGIWLDATELDKIVALNDSRKGKRVVDRIDTGKRIPGGKTGTRTMRQCPRDLSTLSATNSPTQQHVVFDRCPSCLGMFLDAGELKDLAHVTLGERLASLLGR